MEDLIDVLPLGAKPTYTSSLDIELVYLSINGTIGYSKNTEIFTAPLFNLNSKELEKYKNLVRKHIIKGSQLVIIHSNDGYGIFGLSKDRINYGTA